MKSTLRTKLAAAALLLVPMGALIAAQPAAAQDRGFDGRPGHSQHWQRDTRAPEIFAVSPAQSDRVGERGLTRISARFSDDRSGVNPRSVTLRVDGRDVTGRARLDGDDIRYASDLRPGRHSAELLVRDRAGNLARRAWTFDVVDQRHYGYAWGRDQDRRW